MKGKFDVVKIKRGLGEGLSSIIALLFAFVAGGLIVTTTGVSPIDVFASLIKGGLGSPMALAGTLNRMAPILLAGLAITAGNSCGVFNLGFSGQFYMGFLLAGFVGYILPLPAILLIPVTILSAIVGSVLWALIPITLKLRRGVDLIFSCIMLNNIAIFLANYLIQQFPGYIPTTGGSPNIQDAAMLPYLITSPYKISLSVLVALAGLVVLYILLFKTRNGYEMRAAGLNQEAAYSAGINVQKKALSGMVVSGVFTGICAALELMCTTGRVLESYDPGYMGLGIAVAMLGKQNPGMLLIAGFLFGAMKNGTTLMQMNTGISSQFIFVIEGLLIIFIGITPLFRYIANRLNERRRRHA